MHTVSTQHTVLISARKRGAIGIQSLGLRYRIAAESYAHAVREALDRAHTAFGATHENFTPETGQPVLLVEGGKLRVLSPTTWIAQ